MNRISLLLVLVVFGIVSTYLYYRPKPAVVSPQTYVPPTFMVGGTYEQSKVIQSTAGSGLSMDEMSKLVQKTTREADVKVSDATLSIGVTSHHLPTAAPLVAEFYKTLAQNKGPRSTFVIVGPDHYEMCKGTVSTTYTPYHTPFGELAISPLAKELGIHQETECFKNEHAITVHANYIKYYFPNATIVPILFSSRTTEKEIAHVQKVLEASMGNFCLIGSLDFNHYHSLSIANASDDRAQEAVLSMNEAGITKSMLDSVPTMKLVMRLAKKQKLLPNIVHRVNSYEYTGLPENTTSYMNIIYR